MNEFMTLYQLYFKNKEYYQKIYEQRLNSESTEKFDFKINGDDAFLYLHPEHFKLVSEIYQIDRSVLKVYEKLPTVALQKYIKDTLISEIKSTNDIEGIISTRKEINTILNQMNDKKHDRLYGMVNRYKFLLENKRVPLKNPTDIRKIFDELVSKEVIENEPKDALDGSVFRASDVFIYKASGSVLHKGVKPESEIITTMAQALDILNNDKYDILIRMSLFHYLFGYIHPFYNGNGRVSRFITSSLMSDNFTAIMGFNISSQIKSNKKEYYEAFEKTSSKYNKGDLGTFVYIFLKIIKNAFEYVLKNLTEQQEKLGYYEKMIKDKSEFSENEKNLIFILVQNILFSNDGMGLKELAENSKMSEIWTRKTVSSFIKKDLIVKQKDGHKNLYQINLDKLTI
ncbi:conserved hypothetical protein [Alteracholeplasma palmae J233]|uniref:Fido domain-containing protein n=1 Tax=Alteracholeplasma palmae (strain ATCC 49389 / J233) TaxID=1318466 RepID=U4KLP8_ALTPJ|nr:Fic family protein [Alteracholeplasma palmae]CCV64822.1 conserved hypothetical protein [Alteracholeplasma palmae J233]